MRTLLIRTTIVLALGVTVIGIVVGFRGLARGDGPSRQGEATGASASPRVPSEGTLSPVASATPAPVVSSHASFVDVRGGSARRLPRSIRAIHGATHFRVSPDGTMLAFDDGEDVYIATIDGKRVHILTPPRYGGSANGPSWSPDGSRVAFSEGGAGYVVDISMGRNRGTVRPSGFDESRSHSSISGPRRGAAVYVIDQVVARPRRGVWRLEFSRDGEQMLFTSMSGRNRSPARLWVVPSDGGRARMLPLKGAAFGTYSPDGTTIAYRKTGFDGVETTQMTSGAVWVADADGSDPRGRRAGWMSQIDPMALWPVWSPDGTLIAYEHLYCQGVFVLDVRTGRVTKIGDGVDPGWADAHTLIIGDFGEEDCR